MRSAPAVPSRDLDRRRVPRAIVNHAARLRVGDMIMEGTIQDVGVGGVFFHTRLLVEIGERAIVELGSETPVPGRVVWLRGPSHPLGPGVGLSFELRDARAERAALELVLAVFDGSEPTS